MQTHSGPRAHDIDWTTLSLALAAAVTIQTTIPTARLGTTYRAIESGISPSWIAVISAGFALFPITLAVPIGRQNDKGFEKQSFCSGALLLLCTLSCLAWLPASTTLLFCLTCILGVSQMLILAALQSMLTRCCDFSRMDTVLGYFMMATSLGQIIGPLIVAVMADGAGSSLGIRLLAVCTSGAVILVLIGILLLAFRLGGASLREEVAAPVALSDLLAAKGLIWTIAASSLCVTTGDLILVYFPVMCLDRGIDPGTMGLLLTLRACTAMLSRAFFVRLIARLGRERTMLVAVLLASVAILPLAMGAPVIALALAMCLSGFGLGIAVTASLSLTLALAPAEARATAMSLRLTANRIGQFAIPVLSGTLVSVAGTGSVFIVMSGMLATSGALAFLRRGAAG
jgi:MFS family permease